MTNKQRILVALGLPFATVIIVALLGAAVVSSPVIGIYFMWSELLDYSNTRLKIKETAIIKKNRNYGHVG